MERDQFFAELRERSQKILAGYRGQKITPKRTEEAIEAIEKSHIELAIDLLQKGDNYHSAIIFGVVKNGTLAKTVRDAVANLTVVK